MGGQWILGFTEGEGSFYIDSRTDRGNIVSLNFNINQHSRDYDLMVAIRDFIGVGQIRLSTKLESTGMYVHSNSACINFIIPFFNSLRPFHTTLKSIRYNYFLEAADIFISKKQLTPEGKKRLLELSALSMAVGKSKNRNKALKLLELAGLTSFENGRKKE